VNEDVKGRVRFWVSRFSLHDLREKVIDHRTMYSYHWHKPRRKKTICGVLLSIIVGLLLFDHIRW